MLVHLLWHSGDLLHFSSPTFQVLPSQRAATTKTKELPEKESTVYSAKLIHCLYKGTVLHCVSVLLHHRCGGLYTCALYIFRFWSLSPSLRRSSFRVQICGESTLGLNLRDLSVFFSFLEFLWTMHHQLAKRAVIVVIICLSEECFQHNQCFNQWSPLAPAKYIFTAPPSDVYIW